MDSSKQAPRTIQNDEFVRKLGSSRAPNIPTINPKALQMNGVYQTLLGCILQIKKLAPAITMTQKIIGIISVVLNADSSVELIRSSRNARNIDAKKVNKDNPKAGILAKPDFFASFPIFVGVFASSKIMNICRQVNRSAFSKSCLTDIPTSHHIKPCKQIFSNMKYGVNRVTFVGNVGEVPRVTKRDGEAFMANFPLATNEFYMNKEGEEASKTEWHRIVNLSGTFISIIILNRMLN